MPCLTVKDIGGIIICMCKHYDDDSMRIQSILCCVPSYTKIK